MSNNYFEFKKFLIKQDKCSMKVCTDACLFGAIAAQSLKLKAENCLDIGTGTGLLALMYAQKNHSAIIDAVEIDEAAANQAKENFELSHWKERMHLHHTSIQQSAHSSIHQSKYDIIISNPPFYEDDLKSSDEKRNLALHSNKLNFKELIPIADSLLKTDGNFFVMLPYHRTKYFIELLKETLYVKENVSIKQTSKHNYFRSILWLTKKVTTSIQSEIIIMNGTGEYTNKFIALLKDYYLYL